MKIWQIVLLVVGVIILALCISAYAGAPEQEAAFERAVELQEAVVLPENEGRIVIIHGVVTVDQLAYDEEKQITLPSFAARRTDDRYLQTKTKKGEEEWDWRTFGNQDIFGEASLGGFSLDRKILEGFGLADRLNEEDFIKDELEMYHHTFSTKGEYLSDEPITAVRTNLSRSGHESLNQTRFSYKIFWPGETRVMTLVGVQRGNRLMRSEDIYVSPVNEGLQTKDVLASSAQSGLMVGLIIGALAALACLFFAFKGVLYMKTAKA